jgi:hypothetical protein
MKSPARSVAWLLPFLLTGCFEMPIHKKHPVESKGLAPGIQTSQSLQVVSVPLPPRDTVIAGNPIYNVKLQAEPIRPPAKHRKPAVQDDAAIASEPQAANPPVLNPAVSAIGQLSSGDPADFRQQTENSIAEIERRLNGINHNLNDSELKTADHIREFLKQARAALASGDVEGAQTLAGKAQVLLAELTK